MLAMDNGMMNENNHTVVPKMVLQVMDKFVAAMRADPDIPDDAISRLDDLLRKGTVPKPDDINAVLFEPPSDGET